MKNIVLVMFIIFIVWMITGAYLVNTEHERAQIVVGLGILYLSFIFMPSSFITDIEAVDMRNIF